MTDLIRRLSVWVCILFGIRRAYRRPARHLHPVLSAQPPKHTPLPAHRSPYGLDTPLDGAANVAVRPYLVVHEQRQRRRELAIEALGLNMPGPYWSHGVEVA